MFNFAEYIVRDIIRTKLNIIRNDATNAVVNDMFPTAYATAKTEALAWLKSRKIAVRTGWSVPDVEVPCISVLLPGQHLDKNFIDQSEYIDTTGSVESKTEIARFIKDVRIMVATEDPDMTIFLSNIVEYIIFAYLSDILGEGTNYIFEIKGFSCGEIEYLKNLFPQLWIQGIVLSLQVENRYKKTGASVSLITEVDVTHEVEAFVPSEE